MAQTHYIEMDEEIISLVGRLRKSGEPDNVFVFPKRALILQSIVNLKLLEREAKKLGKKITIVTQDNEGKLLAEKAGFATEQYHEETMRNQDDNATARFTVHHGENIPMPVRSDGVSKRAPHSNALGSNDFYSGGGRTSQPSLPVSPGPMRETPSPRPVTPLQQPQQLRIRNAAPPIQTSLNSLRTPSLSPRPMSSSMNQREYSGGAMPTNFVPQAKRPPTLTPPRDADRQEKLHRFLSGNRGAGGEQQANTPLPPRPIRSAGESLADTPPSKLAPWAFVVLGCLSAVAIVGAAIFIFLPKAEVFITPQGAEETFKYQFTGVREVSTGDPKSFMVPARVVEIEKTLSVTHDATGEEGSGSAKARGTVIISNDFSAAPQPLVATTRVVTSDGKVYRLIEGVTVPGVNETGGKREPGAIEVGVIADQAGESFNIGPSDFKIPGFQGSAKYDKFSVKSTKPMVGGGSGSSGGTKTVARGDIESADKKARAEVEAHFLSEIEGGLPQGEKLVRESLEVTPVGTPTAPSVGTVGTSFEYGARFKLRAFVISEEAIRRSLDEQSITSNEAASVSLRPVSYELSYGTLLPNFNEGKIELSVQAKMVLRAPVDTQALREELLGQDEDGIRAILEKHPEIKRLKVEFKPKIFIASIPTDGDRVTLIIGDEPEKE